MAKGYVVCATPRSGSTYLCQLLTATGVLGRPLEWFNGPGRRRMGMDDYPDDPERQVDAVRRHGAGLNGVYGVKVFAYQADAVAGTRWLERLPEVRFVHLTRRDLLGQALSWTRASQTQRFRSTQTAAGEARFDAALIADHLRAIARDDARWRLFFARNGLSPLKLEYEAVAADPPEAARAVCALMGVAWDGVWASGEIDLEVQRDGETDLWRERFVREAGDQGALDPL